MINPIAFLWKQFNGPQITAVCQALWQYFYDTYNETLDYLHNFSIDTATTEHLSIIGITEGIARPLVPIPDESMMLFDEEYAYEPGEGTDGLIPEEGHRNSEHGFADVNDPYGMGGRLATVHFESGYTYISSRIYRNVLKGNAQSEGQLGSLRALDDIVYALWRSEHATAVPTYRLEYAANNNSSRVIGDIEIDLGVTGDWSQPYEVQAQIKLLGKTVYYPIPKLIAKITEGDSSIDPYGFVRILLQTEEDVYGLDAMWEGIGTPSDIAPPLDEEPEFDDSPLTTTELQSMWRQDQEWIDEDAPIEEFEALTVEQIQIMW